MRKSVTLMLLLVLSFLSSASFQFYQLYEVDDHREEYIELHQYRAMQNAYLSKIPIEYKVLFQRLSVGFDPLYLAAMIEVESNWNARAVSPANYNGSRDYGIAQLNSKYVDYFGEKYGVENFDPFDPDQALFVAASHLQYLYEETGNIESALIAYNTGLSAFRSGQNIKSGLYYLHKVKVARDNL